MLSLETLKKLKELKALGLPRHGDKIFYEPSKRCGIYHVNSLVYFNDGKYAAYNPNYCLKVPRLDQLLANIINQSWLYDLRGHYGGGGEIDVWLYDYDRAVNYVANSPEEAAAEALLWILEQEKVTA